MLDWVAGVVASAKAATDITTVLVDMKTDSAVQAKAVELTTVLMQLQQQLMTAQMEQMDLIRQIESLEAELRNARKQDELSSRYMRHQFVTGHVAYKLRPEYQDEEPELYYCSNCLEKGSTLITLHGKDKALHCPACNTNIRATPAPSKVPRRPSTYRI